MKGMYFARPLEYRLEVPRDAFVQGEPLQGTLSVTNRDNKAHSKLSLHVGLAYGVFKEVKADGAKALRMLDRIAVAENFSLKPDAERRADWELPISLTGPIQSKEGGPFLLYGGNLDAPDARGQIDLPVQLAPPFRAFLTTVENYFAFELRGSHCVEDVLEARFKPPSSYPALEELTVLLSLDTKGVHLELHARGRGLRVGGAGGVTVKNRATQKTIPMEQFVPRSGLPNRTLYRSLVGEMLPEIAVRVEKKG